MQKISTFCLFRVVACQNNIFYELQNVVLIFTDVMLIVGHLAQLTDLSFNQVDVFADKHDRLVEVHIVNDKRTTVVNHGV